MTSPTDPPAAHGGFRVALAQISPVLGDVPRNVDLHVDAIGRAREARADVIIFPELSLTGYFLRDVVPEVAIKRDSPVIDTLSRAADGAAVVVGCVEEDEDHRFYNSSFYIADGALRFVHRKVYLPTYGMFDEQRYFAAGNRIAAFDTPFGRAGILICEDMWHLSCGIILAADRVKYLIALSSSPTRGVSSGPKAHSWQAWAEVNNIYARFFGAFVFFVNRVGFEDGVNFWGGSRITAPGGDPLVQSPTFDSHLLIHDIDPALIRRHRIFSPLARDEKMDLTLRELARIQNESRY